MQKILFIILSLLNLTIGFAQKTLYLGGPSYYYPTRPKSGEAWSCDDLGRGKGSKSGDTYWYFVNGVKQSDATIPADAVTTYTIDFMSDHFDGKIPLLGWCDFTTNQTITTTEKVNIVIFEWSQTDIDICLNEPSLDLSKYLTITDGTTLGGDGINIFNFIPSIAGVGDHLIQASRQFDNGTAIINLNIHVKELPPFSFFPPDGVCSDAGNIDLNKYVSTTGILFSGTGVSGSNFLPGNIGGGTKLTATYVNGCTNVISKDVIIVPAFSVSAGPDQKVCLNTPSIQLQDGLPTGGKWSGLNISGSTFSTAGLNAGSYIATYTVNQDGCVKTGSSRIVIPQPPSIIVGPDLTVCLNDDPISLSGSPVGGLWDGPGVNGDLVYPKDLKQGINNITYTIASDICSYTTIKKITANSVPADPLVSGNVQICLNDTLHLIASSPGTTNKYFWYKDGATTAFASGSKLDLPVKGAQNIYVQAQNPFKCNSNNKTLVPVTTSGFAGVKITANKTLIGVGDMVKFSINATSFSDITWDFGDSTGSKENNPPHYYYDLDTFTVKVVLVSALGCASEIVSTNLIKVHGIPRQLVTGIENEVEIETIDDFISAYPLPIQSTLKLDYSLPMSENVTLEIINNLGQKVFATQIQGAKGANQYLIENTDIFSLNGLYFLTIKGEATNKSIKLVK